MILNLLPFPKVRKGDVIQFDGNGQLIYGPSNPGEFLAYSILVIESDKDIRKAGEDIDKIVKSESASMGMISILQSNPTFTVVSQALGELIELISIQLKQNKDDELFRRNGTLLRDTLPPYNISETFTSMNDFIALKTEVIPLIEKVE